MGKVLIERFRHRPGGHCSSTAMRDLLEFYGHTLTEEIVFGLGVGIGFVYYRHPDMAPPVYIGGRIYNLEEQLCGHLGIGMEITAGNNDDEAWEAARAMLDGGEPVMVHADVYHLDYLRARRHFSGHRIVLVGYDEEGGMAFVADNDRDEVQPCSLESLRKARSAAHLPQPAENTLYRFSVPGELKPLADAIPAALSKAARFNIRLRPERAVFSYDGAQVSRGMPGLERFAAEMIDWPETMDALNLTLACKSIYVSAEKGGTGYGGNFRRIYGRFLKEASPLVNEPLLDSLGNEFIEIGDLWTRLSLDFKELSADGRSAVAVTAPVAREIAKREQAAFEALERVAAGLREEEP